MLQRRFVLSLMGVGCLLCVQVLLRNNKVQLEVVQAEVSRAKNNSNVHLHIHKEEEEEEVSEIVQTAISRANNNNNNEVLEGNLHKEEEEEDDDEEEEVPEITTTSTIVSAGIALPPAQLQIPKLILGGAMKGGTSALWEILQKQPLFVPIEKKWPGTREAHFFDTEIIKNKTWNGVPAPEWKAFQQAIKNSSKNNVDDVPVVELTVTPTVIQALRQDYANHWPDINSASSSQQQSSLVTLEKTPAYMYGHHIPALVHKVTPWVKMLFIVREPATRAHSMWKMYHSNSVKYNMTEDFEHYVQLEVESLRQQGVSQAPTLKEYNGPNFQLNASSFALPHTIAQRRLLRDVDNGYTHTMLYRGMYAELLSAWMEQDFQVDNQNLLVETHEHFSQNHLGVVQAIQQYVGAPTTNIPMEVLKKNYHKSKMKSVVSMKESTRQYLELFFQPYNEELEELMGKEWYSKHVGEDWTGEGATDSINNNVA